MSRIAKFSARRRAVFLCLLGLPVVFRLPSERRLFATGWVLTENDR